MSETVAAINQHTAKGLTPQGQARDIAIHDDGRLRAAPLWVGRAVVEFGATSGALDANDALGNKIYFRTSMDGRPLPQFGRVLGLRRIDRSDVVLADTLNLSTRDFVAAASDAAFTISVADAEHFLSSQTFPTGTDLGSAKVAGITDINEDYYSPDRQLVGQFSTTGTPTPTVDAMPIVFIFVLPLE